MKDSLESIGTVVKKIRRRRRVEQIEIRIKYKMNFEMIGWVKMDFEKIELLSVLVCCLCEKQSLPYKIVYGQSPPMIHSNTCWTIIRLPHCNL